MQTTCPDAQVLERFVLGQLPLGECDTLAIHVEGCSHCVEVLRQLQARDPLLESFHNLRPPPDRKPGAVVDGLIQNLKRLTTAETISCQPGAYQPNSSNPTTPAQVCPDKTLVQIPGYEITGILGRGGMGVVYQARQLALQRPVALKMVRAGAQASPEELARFQAEAQAVARLQHPNIVQIYEVSQHEGCPYFSLEYVAGGTLAERINKSPQPVRVCAQVVETLARAIHFAHSHGIVHRDLKPANILLAVASKGKKEIAPLANDHWPLSTVPKITDFGLAKRLEEDIGQTQTGAVMGTPAYMAPEQASGHAKDAGPAVDTYALGVILYEMLTGRLPFTGDTPLSILDKVRSSEPDRPTKLQPKIHRDLETICLKALAKEPVQRYESALALAEDLARFNAGEPIKARPEGLAKRWWRRVRRHPVAAMATVFLTITLLTGGIWFWNWNSVNREINHLTRKIESAMDAPEISDSYVARMEGDLAALEELDSDKAEDARQRFRTRFAGFVQDQKKQQVVRRIDASLDAPELNQAYMDRMKTDLDDLQHLNLEMAGSARQRYHKRFGRFLEDHIRKTNLPPEEIAKLRFWVDKYAAMAPALALPLRAELKQREVGWDPLLRMSAKGQLDIFEPGQVALQKDVVIPDPLANHFGPILTNQSSTNHDELTAEFDERWEEGKEIGLAINVVRGLNLPITALAFSSDGLSLAAAAGGQDTRIGAVKVWEITGKERFTFRPEKPGTMSLVYFPNGSALAVACDGDPHVRILDALNGKILHRFLVPEGTVGSLAMSRDGLTLVTGSGIAGKTGAIHLWNTQTWQVRKTLKGFKNPVGRLALAANGRYLAAAFEDRSVKVFDLAADKEILSGLPFHSNYVPSLCFTSDSKTFIAPYNLTAKEGALVHHIHLWDLASGTGKDFDIGFHSGGMTAMIVSPNDRTVAAASHWNSHLNFFDVSTSKSRLFQKESLPNTFTSLAYSHEGNYLAMGTLEGGIRVRRVDNGQLIAAFENQGYHFVLRPAQPDNSGPFLKNSRVPNSMFTLAITRNGAVMREQAVPAFQIPPGPLQMVARRDGTHLFFQINQLPPLEFQEVQALPARGVFALNWPKGTGLKSLQAMRRHLEENPSSLKKGDEMFAREMYLHALAFFNNQVVEAGTREKEVAQEARFKVALCLVKLQRLQEATAEFERLIGDNQLDGNNPSPWPAVAACELLQLYLKQNRTKDVDTLFDALTFNYKFEQLLPLVSKDTRDKLLLLYSGFVPEVQLVFDRRAIDLGNLDRAVKVHDFFKTTKVERLALRWAYLRGYHFQGKLDLARQTAEDLLADSQAGPNLIDRVAVVEKLGWILRQQGQPQLALSKINQYLDGGDSQIFKPLLVERARIHVALKNWGQAEKDLDTLLQQEPASLPHHQYAGACLARGFLHLRNKDETAALKTWKRGLHSARGKGGQSEGSLLIYSSALDVLSGTMLAALTDDLTPTEADLILDSLLNRRSDGENPFTLFQERMPAPPGILRDMWRTKRGREWARKQSYQEISYAESLRLPLVLFGAEFVHQAALPRDLTMEQEEILWTATDNVYQGFLGNKLQSTQMIGLVFTWKGRTNFLGWGGVSSSLEPALRGPLAYILGYRYLDRLKQPDEALTFFQTAVKDAPANSTLKKLAQAEVDRLKKGTPVNPKNEPVSDPKNAGAWFKHATSLHDKKDLPGAIDAYRKALAIDPKYATAWLKLGIALYDQKMDLPAAIDAFNKCLALDAKNAFAWYSLGLALQDQKDLPGAIGAYKKSVALDPKHGPAWHDLACALDDQKDLPGAIDAFKKAVAIDPKAAHSWRGLGMALDEQKDLAAATEAFKKAVALEPKNAQAWYLLASTYQNKEELPAAVEAYKKSLALEPKNPRALSLLALAYYVQKDWPGTIDAFKKSLALEPNNPTGWRILGTVLHRQDLAAAIDAYKKALAIEPKNAEVWGYLGMALTGQKDLPAAIDAYKKALDIDPKNALHWDNLGIVLHTKKDLPEAINAYKKALNINPKSVRTYNALAWVLATCPDAKCRDGKKAVEMALKAVALQDIPNHWDTLAAAHAEAGNFPEAIRWQERALKDPEFARTQGEAARSRLALYRQMKPFHDK